MVWYGERCTGAIGIFSQHSDVVALADNFGPKSLKRLDDARLGCVNWKLRHQMVTPASATNASSTGGSAWSTSFPKVSI